MALEPRAGLLVKDGYLARLLRQRAGTEHVGEEMVVAEPVALVVQRHDEQVVSFQGLQHAPAIVPAGERIAQRGAEPVEDRGLQQEGTDAVGLTVQDFVDQVVDDVPVVAGEGPYETRQLLPPLDRERGQLEAHDPALGARLQDRDVGCRKAQPHRLVEEGSRFLLGESQVRGPQLRQLAASPEAGQGQGRIRPGGDHQVHPRREMLEQKGDGAVDRFGVDDVVIVEDERDVLIVRSDLVDQTRQDPLGCRRPS